MNRRQFICSFAASTALYAPATEQESAFAAPSSVGQAVPLEFKEDARVPTLEEFEAKQQGLADESRGTAPPQASEIAKARMLRDASPTGVRPIEVARFFARLRAGEYDSRFGGDTSLYGEEWPVRANPLIVTFFDATTLRQPAGDQTAWCAAFVNWCIGRAVLSNDTILSSAPTKSAASSSFRKWGDETSSPKDGDIVVFRHKQFDARGHVGFFISKTSNGVYVLGGNQMPARLLLPDGTYERRNTGEINVSWFPYSGAALELLGFRTNSLLRSEPK